MQFFSIQSERNPPAITLVKIKIFERNCHETTYFALCESNDIMKSGRCVQYFGKYFSISISVSISA